MWMRWKLSESLFIAIRAMHRESFTADKSVDSIIAVHGIGVDPKTTWVHKKTQVNWLSDQKMLPSSLPTARIMVFGYNSIWFGKDAVRQSLDSLANKLLRELMRKREACPQRPIIFIAHCSGGLIIQRAYTIAALHMTHYPHLAGSIRGMVFLGTPHQGLANDSNLGSQSQVYAAIVAANAHIEDNVLLTLVQNNDVLVSAVHEFSRMIKDLKPAPRLFCFYDQKVTNVGVIVAGNLPLEFVVGESSATLISHEKEGLALDHFGINEFENVEDNHYQCVLEHIKQMVKEAKSIEDAAPGKQQLLIKPEIVM
ncbi:hypothetical protein CSPAE12_05519 [Colletotrichum incanum]|nr:hypothetical protein CSPAE12_05519 [Colletotrichum incanum]